MGHLRFSLRDVAVGAGYFCLAAPAALFTRFDGGVAFLWIANAYLIAELVRRRRAEWPAVVACCGIASAMTTSWFGLGWDLALPFVVFNLTESFVAALLLARWRTDRRAFESLAWMAPFIVSVGVVAPLAMAIPASLWMTGVGRPLAQTFVNLFCGHALGNLTFVPFFILLSSGRLLQRWRSLATRRAIDTSLLLLLVAATVVFTFSQDDYPLLFLPAGPIILAIFRGREIGAVGSMVILGMVGGGMTALGHGPIELIDGSQGARMHFFQFYLAAAVLTIVPITADLRNRSRLFRELRVSEARYRLLADHSTDIILHMKPDGRIIYASPAISQLGGYRPADVRGKMVLELVPDDSRLQVIEGYKATAAANGSTHSYRHLARLADGRVRWFESHSRTLIDPGGRIQGILSVVRDISQQVAAEGKLEAAAMTDPLTGLLNRRAFTARADAMHKAGKKVMVALMDIDHFKRVNDQFGHEAGDMVLRSFAKIAGSIVRRDDVVARIGGEEFALLLPGLSHHEGLAICDRLRREFADNVQLTDTGPVQVTISGGLVIMGEEGIDEALKMADRALYEAKNGGRDQLALAA